MVAHGRRRRGHRSDPRTERHLGERPVGEGARCRGRKRRRRPQPRSSLPARIGWTLSQLSSERTSRRRSAPTRSSNLAVLELFGERVDPRVERRLPCRSTAAGSGRAPDRRRGQPSAPRSMNSAQDIARLLGGSCRRNCQVVHAEHFEDDVRVVRLDQLPVDGQVPLVGLAHRRPSTGPSAPHGRGRTPGRRTPGSRTAASRCPTGRLAGPRSRRRRGARSGAARAGTATSSHRRTPVSSSRRRSGCGRARRAQPMRAWTRPAGRPARPAPALSRSRAVPRVPLQSPLQSSGRHCAPAGESARRAQEMRVRPAPGRPHSSVHFARQRVSWRRP